MPDQARTLRKIDQQADDFKRKLEEALRDLTNEPSPSAEDARRSEMQKQRRAR